MRSNFFRSYWFWHCGEGFQTILMMWYMTFHAKLSASEIGFYQSLQLLPFLIFTAMGGSLTDRIGARISFAASTGLFAITLGFYGLTDPLLGFHPWLFAGYCLLSGVLSAVSNPAIDTFIPEATPRPAGENALLAATVHNIAKLSGNAATLLLPVLSALGGFVVNGLLMATSVFFLARHPAAPRPGRPNRQAHAFRRVPAHFRANPASFDIFLGSVMLGMFTIPAMYIFHPLVLRSSFPEEGGLIGLTGLVGWIGAIAASALALRLSSRIRHPGRVALAVWAAVAGLFLLLPMVGSFPAFLILLCLIGGNAVGKAMIYGHYLRDAPEVDRGFLIGIDQTAFWGLATLGTMALGALVDHIGLGPAILANSAAIFGCLAVLLVRGRLWSLPRA
ncbi:MAG: MFS transporter [Tabrizicola sp.]|nr:MFS transporter [Tabrizicola sp.]